MRVAVLFCLGLCFLHSFSIASDAQVSPSAHIGVSNATHDGSVLPEQQIDETYLQEVEQNAFKEQVEGELNEWVVVEMREMSEVREFNTAETMVVRLGAEQSYQFKWNLAAPKSRKRDYLLMVNVYTAEAGSDLALNHNPDQESFLEVQVRPNLLQNYTPVGKVYVSRAFSVNFQSQSGRFIRLTNRNGQEIFLQVSMQQQIAQIDVVGGNFAKNQHFAISAKKLEAIYEEVKATDRSRSRTYKWQWGFLQREERYDDEMLRLTGVEMVAILVTAIVQMYCIKSLLDNKQII